MNLFRKKNSFILSLLRRYGKVRHSELVNFTRELAVLNGAGLSLPKALHSLRDQMLDGKFKDIVSGILDGIERGEMLSDTLAHYDNVFSRVYINMVKAGEMSGNLDVVLNRLANLLEKQQKLRKKVKGALMYPAFVLTMAFLILSMLMIFVVPTFTKMFDDLGGELPTPTKVLISVSNIFVHYWYLILLVIFGIIFGFKALLKIEWFKYYYDRFLLSLPVMGDLIVRVTIARFARMFGMLLHSGVPILNALYIVKDGTQNSVYANAIPKIIDSVKEGESLSKLFEESGVFPNLVVKMVGVGEETGQLSDMFVKIADTYEEDVDVLVASISSLMEPFLIVIMGLIVGFIVISMFLPLFNLTELL